MKSEDFDYDLPKDLIAYYPTDKRDSSRLLVIDKNSGNVSHKSFSDITDYLIPGDLLVLNNTKVIPAKLSFKREGKDAEILLTQRISGKEWKVLTTKPKQDLKLNLIKDFSGVLKKSENNEWLIVFNQEADEYIQEFGKMPLPPYIERDSEEKDKTTYQTVYAKNEGAIAAPTAGLHFTDKLLEEIRSCCIDIKFITLHVGVGTFRPVKTENISDHVMHKEYVRIPEDTSSAVNFAKSQSRRVVAVGTTVVRALEAATDGEGKIRPFDGPTDLFIYPPYEYKIVDAMITNFHLPRSTLLMLVSAFCGRELLFESYKKAVEEKYRFLSYGDSMFIY